MGEPELKERGTGHIKGRESQFLKGRGNGVVVKSAPCSFGISPVGDREEFSYDNIIMYVLLSAVSPHKKWLSYTCTTIYLSCWLFVV